MRNKSLGFTLIELLVVISIIAILTSLLIVNVVDIRQRARDGERKADLRQIQSALEIYRSDAGEYPSSIYPAEEPKCDQPLKNSTGSITYIEKVPCDPFSKLTYYYNKIPSQQYKLIACLENTKDLEKDAVNDSTVCAGNSSSYTAKNP